MARSNFNVPCRLSVPETKRNTHKNKLQLNAPTPDYRKTLIDNRPTW